MYEAFLFSVDIILVPVHPGTWMGSVCCPFQELIMVLMGVGLT